MSIKIQYTTSHSDADTRLGTFVCKVHKGTFYDEEENILPEFNKLLDDVTKIAFLEGIEFNKKYSDMIVY